MFQLNEDLSIYATRGDIVFFSVSAESNGLSYRFQPGDVVRIKIYGKKDATLVALEKDFPVTESTNAVEIFLGKEDTKIGEVISKPKDYWYEIELNPNSHPQTIIGYDEDGAKVFKLFPEGKDLVDPEITPEDIPVVDAELDPTSTRPVQNQAVARELLKLQGEMFSKTLLWENFKPMSAFNGQLVEIPAEFGVMGNYDSFEIVFTKDNESRVYSVHIAPMIGYSEAEGYNHRLFYIDGQWQWFRHFSIVENGFTFHAGYQQQATDSPSMYNGYIIPLRIYGIKGVK